MAVARGQARPWVNKPRALIEAFELYVSEHDAERRRWQIVSETPEWERLLVVEPIDLGQPVEPCWN